MLIADAASYPNSSLKNGSSSKNNVSYVCYSPTLENSFQSHKRYYTFSWVE